MLTVEIETYFSDDAPERRAAKALTVIIYDISSQKQRNRMVKYLEGYGHRVQKSAFEAWLSDKQFDKLCSGMDRLVKPDDHVKTYRLRGSGNAYTWGEHNEIDTEDVVII